MKKFKILFEDDTLVIIDKPAGLLTLPDRYKDDDSVLSVAKRSYPELALCHRIDRDTSGILVMVKNKEDLSAVATQFENRTVVKHYLAIVDGTPDESGSIDAPIIESSSKRGKMLTARKGMESLTTYETVENLGNFSLVKVRILTGRQHQVRVHMKYIGHPLMVDRLYGSRDAFFLSEIKRKYKRSGDIERPMIERHTLHAYSITFKHPKTGEKISVESPLPKDLKAVINQIKKNMRK